jgi:D-alanyl-D-alanine carboxypeptidase
MDAISAIDERIDAIRRRFTAPTPTTAPSPSHTSASSSSSFVDALGTATLRGALGSTGTQLDGRYVGAGSTAVTPRAPGTYGPVTPPAALAGFGNGRIPASMLTPIGQGEHRLEANAAAAFRLMAADAARDGVRITVTDSYRPYERQESIAATAGLYEEGGVAARPGQSSHGWGLSVDIDQNPATVSWLRANGARYGFVEDVAREPWHWTYRAAIPVAAALPTLSSAGSNGLDPAALLAMLGLGNRLT